MTHDVYFDDSAIKLCSADLKLLKECNEHIDERGHGRLISCLYDRMKNITESTCRGFINQLQLVIFTDWRLSEFFSEGCYKDIVDLKCGRLDAENDTVRPKRSALLAKDKPLLLVAP